MLSENEEQYKKLLLETLRHLAEISKVLIKICDRLGRIEENVKRIKHS